MADRIPMILTDHGIYLDTQEKVDWANQQPPAVRGYKEWKINDVCWYRPTDKTWQN